MSSTTPISLSSSASSSASSSSASSSASSSGDSSSTGEAETPLRPVFCLKKKDADLKEVEDKYDCFILDFDDPLETLNSKINDLSVSQPGDGDEIALVAEKGQVACRDYPHSRHLCVKYPFETGRERYCELCYCYVCDIAAPCADWRFHCSANEKNSYWRNLRAEKKGTRAESSFDE